MPGYGPVRRDIQRERKGELRLGAFSAGQSKVSALVRSVMMRSTAAGRSKAHGQYLPSYAFSLLWADCGEVHICAVWEKAIAFFIHTYFDMIFLSRKK